MQINNDIKTILAKSDTIKSNEENNKKLNAYVHVGCGDKVKEGYVSCDIRDAGNTDIICEAWNIHHHFENAEEIYSRHMLEHLSFNMVERTLTSWYAALKVGGRAVILLPDLDLFLSRFNEAKWQADEWRDRSSFTRHLMAGFWGWQRDETSLRGTDIGALNYWDVHKSGFNEESLRFIMRSVGFTDIEKYQEEFGFIGYKRMDNIERQISMYPEKIRYDHSGRYEFAAKHIAENSSILDAACGIGYGSFIMAKEFISSSITALDIDENAIIYANEFYRHENINFIQADICTYTQNEKVDAIVSFETLEHIKEVDLVLNNFYKHLKNDGIFICSTPNENSFPFDPTNTPYHVRHYTPTEFKELLERNGFEVKELYSQHDSFSKTISHDCEGRFLIAICRRK